MTIRKLGALLAPAAAATLIAGCGGGSTTTTVTVPAKTSAAPASDNAKQPASTQQDTAAADASQDAAVDSVTLSTDMVFIANYCVHVLGARIGKQQPPGAKLTQQKNTGVTTLLYYARHRPDATMNGKPLSSLLQSAEQSLSNGDCDPASARKIRDAAADL